MFLNIRFAGWLSLLCHLLPEFPVPFPSSVIWTLAWHLRKPVVGLCHSRILIISNLIFSDLILSLAYLSYIHLAYLSAY
ncbi:hypothetical protein B0H19DRAFT_1148559 [Mycena capillaripes]|nr:hypothetical protein B0H19DRAFT_1148559 [Mycena capillaripes]